MKIGEKLDLVLSLPPNYRNYLHVIIDEIYMLTVFDDSLKFHSVLSIER